MKKRTIFGSMICVILLLAITWIIPAQVKAYDTEEEKILDELNNFSNNLSNDEDFKQLLAIHENQEIENLFKQVFTAQSTNEINNLVEKYQNLIDTGLLSQLTEALNEKYTTDFETIKTDINNLYHSNSDTYEAGSEENYYIITENENGIKIKKQKTEETGEETLIIRGTDGAIKISDGEWITEDMLDNLKEFLNILMIAGVIGSYAGIYIGLFGQIIGGIGFERIGFLIFRFGFRFGVFSLAVSVSSSVLLMIIDILEKLFENNNSKQKNKTKCLIERLENSFFIKKIFSKIMRYIKNFNANMV